MDKTYSSMKRVVFMLVFACSVIFNQAHAASFVVNNSASGSAGTGNNGTFEYVIAQVNAAGAGPHTITFSVATVNVAWGSTAITVNNVTIDGGVNATTCEPGVLMVGPGWKAIDLTGVTGCTIRGIKFQDMSVNISNGSGHTIQSCWFSYNATGTATTGLQMNSHIVAAGTSGLTIGGTGCNRNLFPLSLNHPVTLNNCPNATISGNYFGLNATGTAIVASGTSLTAVNIQSSSNSTVSNNVFSFGTLTPISLTTISTATISGNYIGSNATGTTVLASRGDYGIYLDNASSVSISNNVIMGCPATTDATIAGDNYGSAIYATTTATNSLSITNNKIGVNVNGVTGTGFGNKRAGVYLKSTSNSVTISNNIIGNSGLGANFANNSGIYIEGHGTLSSIVIQNNRIGLDINNAAAGCSFAGLFIRAFNGTFANSFSTISVTGNTIGNNGDNPIQKSHGIAFYLVGTSGTPANVTISNNYVGTNSTGAVSAGNAQNGIEINASFGFTISSNLIANNKGTNPTTGTYATPAAAGIYVADGGNVTIQANTIRNHGDAGAGMAINNGIAIENSSNVLIGSASNTALGNTITTSGHAGILVERGADAVVIRRNSIYCNGTLGISLNLAGNKQVASTTPGNASYGNVTVSGTPYAEPVITNQTSTSVTGTAPANSSVDIYGVYTSAFSGCPQNACDALNKRQGGVYITTVAADATTGAFSYTGALPANTDAFVVTATSTGSPSRTSEFSNCRIVSICPNLTLSPNPVTVCVSAGTQTFTVTDANSLLLAPSTVTWTVSGGLTYSVTASSAGSQTISVTLPTGITSATSYTVSVSVTASGCTAANASTTLNVHPNPVITGLPASLSLCHPASSNLNPTISGGVTPYTYSWANSTPATGTLSASNIANPTFTTAAAGTTTLTLTVTGAAPSSCSTTATGIPVTVNATPSPVLSTAGPNCENTNATVSVTPTGGTYAWTVTGTGSSIVSGGGVGNSSVTVTANIASTTAASQDVTVSLVQTINGCPSAAVQRIVRFDNTPVAVTPSAIPNQCNATSVNLSTTAPSFGTAAWSSTPTTTIANPSSNNTTATVTAGSPSTTYQFTWTVSNGACANATANVSFTNYAPVTANATGTVNICNSTSATLSATAPSPGTGTWSGTGVSFSPNANDPAATVSGLGAAPSSTSLTWTVTNGSCSANTTVTVNNVADNNAVVTTADGPLCSGTATTYNIDATSVSSPQSGVWTVLNQPIAANASIGSSSSASTTVSGLSIQGTYTFVWTVTNGGICAAKQDEVNIHVYTPVTADAADILSCNSTSATLSATNPSPATGTWSGTGVSFSPNANDPAATVSGLGAAPSTTTVTWTVINGPFTLGANTCTASKDITVTNSLTASADAGTPPAPVCVTAPGTVTLNGSSAGTWTVSNQPSGASAVVNSPNLPSTTVSGLTVAGTYTFTLAVSNSCGSASDDVSVVVSPEATANANDVNLCGLPVGSVQLNATGTGTWSTASGITIDNPSDAASTLSGLTTGQFTFVWTVLNGACQATDNAVLTIDAAPDAQVQAVAARCETNTSPINIEALSGVGVWTVTSGTGIIDDATDATTTITGITPGTLTTVTWTVQSQYQICANATANVQIDVQVSPTSDAGSDFSTCLTSTTLNANVAATGTWTVIAGTGTFADDNNPVTVVSGLSSGVNTFQWTVEGDACADAVSQVDVTNTTADLNVTVASDDDTLCAGSSRGASVSVTTSTGSGNYTYTWSDDNGPLFTTTNPNVTFTPGAGTTTYYVVVGDADQLGCNSAVASVDIVAVSDQNLVIPNLMTPNQDALNDVLLIKDEYGKDLLPGSYLQVVNRWGEQVFESEDYRNSWKAPNTSDGMYFYYLKAGCGGRVYKGWIHILGNVEP